MLFSTCIGASILVRASEHEHTDDCYIGSRHSHIDSCYGSETTCNNGCSKHSHSGSSSSYGGCYTGDWNEPYTYYCGGTLSQSSLSMSHTGSDTEYCNSCQKETSGTSYTISLYWYSCSKCGDYAAVGWESGDTCYWNCSECGWDKHMGGGGFAEDGDSHSVTYSGYYDCNCGYSTSTYYKMG